MAKQASELTQDEKLDVVTLGLLPISSVVEWLLVQDIHFRTAIAKVLTSTNFTVILDLHITFAFKLLFKLGIYYTAPGRREAENHKRLCESDCLCCSLSSNDQQRWSPRCISCKG